MGRFGSARKFGGVLVTLCALAGAVTASAEPRPAPEIAEIPHSHPPSGEAEQLLRAHNAERIRLGLPPLTWSPALAREAGKYARVLAARGQLRHSHPSARRDQGENLWLGTAGAWDSGAMVEMFLDERRHFRPAAFPDVSKTGKWSDVGHYTQIVWRDTKEVGCAIATGRGNDVLVCRYYPAGNVMGQAPY